MTHLMGLKKGNNVTLMTPITFQIQEI